MPQSRIVRTSELPWESEERGTLFAYRRQRLAKAAGGRGLGCSLVELQPDKTACPFHYHLGNEEAIYVLEGRGTLRLGERRVALAAGDYVALLPEPMAAHQLTNTGDQPLRYLVVSTMNEPDVVVYPDSNKLGVIAGSAPGGDARTRTLLAFVPRAAEVDYWQGEVEGSPAPADAQPSEQPAGDELIARIEQELSKLEQRLGLERLAAVSSSVRGRIEHRIDQLKQALGRERAETTPAADEDDLDRKIDDEIAALKRRLGLT